MPWLWRTFSAEGRVRWQSNSCGICGEQRGTGTDLYTSSVFVLTLPLREGQAGKAWESSNKAVLYFSYKYMAEKCLPIVQSYKGSYDALVVTPVPFSHVAGNHLLLFLPLDTNEPIKVTTWRVTLFEKSVIADLFEFLLLCGVWSFHDHIHKTLLLISVMSQKNVHFCHPVSSRSVLIFPSQQCLGIQSGILTQ